MKNIDKENDMNRSNKINNKPVKNGTYKNKKEKKERVSKVKVKASEHVQKEESKTLADSEVEKPLMTF